MARKRPIDDSVLVEAMRQRILDEIQRKHEQAIINNVYGGGGGAGSPTMGVADQMGGGPEGEDPYDYFVDITRKDLPINPETGKPSGWEKAVHRHRKKKLNPNRPSPKGQSDEE